MKYITQVGLDMGGVLDEHAGRDLSVPYRVHPTALY